MKIMDLDPTHPLALAVLIALALGTKSSVATEHHSAAAAPTRNGSPNEISVAQAIQPAPGEQRGQPKASSSGGAMGETNGDAGSMSADPAKAPKGSELTPSSKAKAGVSAHREQSASQKAVVKAVNGFAGQTFSQLLQTNTDKNAVISPLGLGTALNLLASGAGGETAKLLRFAELCWSAEVG